MFIFTVSCIVNAGGIVAIPWYQTTFGWESLDPYSLVAALVIIIVILSVIVGWLWSKVWGKR